MATILLSDLIEPTIAENQRVYILTDGMYSDFHIVAVFRTEEDAEVYAATHRRQLEIPEIHEWAVFARDCTSPPVSVCWEVWIYEDGLITNRIMSYSFDSVETVSLRDQFNREYRVTFTVSKGTTIEQVDKIARDRLAKYRYEMLEKEMLSLKEQISKE